MLDLIVSSDGDIPIFIRGGSGNESDKAMFGKILVEYSKQVDFESIMIADSALYSAKNLILIKELKWISRVPLSIKKAKYLVKIVTSKNLKDSSSKGYRYLEEKVIYGGIEQRWMVVESEERKKSDLNKIINRIEKESAQANREITKIIKQEFEQVSLVTERIEEIKKSFNVIKDLTLDPVKSFEFKTSGSSDDLEVTMNRSTLKM